MKLYRLEGPKKSGWASASGYEDDFDPGEGWRPASRREFVRWYLTTARFNWIELTIILIIGTFVRAVLWPH